MTWRPWLRFGRSSNALGREEPRAKPVRMVDFPAERGMENVRKRWYNVLQGFGGNNRYEAEMTNQRRGLGEKI